MREMELQEKRRATMRQNAAEPNAKRAARAASETWRCKTCKEMKGRIRYSERQWNRNRSIFKAVCLTCSRTSVCFKECGKPKGQREYS